MTGFFAKLLRRGATGPSASAVGTLPPGVRVYAIGDIHGRDDLLKDLLAQIEVDAKGFTGTLKLVFVGDYIDRGPDSKGVVDRLMHGLPNGMDPIFLRGNHEQSLMDFMADPMAAAAWLSWGGDACLASYGVVLRDAHGQLRGPHILAADLRDALEDSGHAVFYLATQLWHTEGGYLFVHAGVRPHLALEYQIPGDIMMIRDDFLKRDHGLPFRVVFGHTIMPQPLITPDRIGLDTGAYASGILTAVALETTETGEQVTRLLQT